MPTPALEIKTYADIIAAIREELKISATDGTTIARLQRDVNIIYSEVVNTARWWWLQQNTTVQLQEFYNNGTCNLLQNSSQVMMMVPLGRDFVGYYFSMEGDNEIYRIESQAPDGSYIKLARRYINPSVNGANFKIWNDRIPLPTNCKETFEITRVLGRNSLDNLGIQEFRRLTTLQPKRNGFPEAYYTGDFVEPFATAPIGSMPILISRSSDGVIKTLLFNGPLPAAMVPGYKIKVSAAFDPSYNGEVTIAKVTQTNVALDTLVYTGSDDWTEVETPDPDLHIEKIITTTDSARYRSIFVYPSITQTRVGLSVDYNKVVPSLADDLDEPIIPIDDRIVLVYGALARAWKRERNPEEAKDAYLQYKDKLGRMAGQIQDTLDKPILRPSRLYLAAKRTRRFNFAIDGWLGQITAGPGGNNSMAILGNPNTVAVYDALGNLTSSPITTAQLNFIAGGTSNFQNQINALSASLGSLSITDAQVAAGAGIALSKLAALTPSSALVTDGSGVITPSAVTATQLSFLSNVIALTSAAIPNNTVSPLPVILIPVVNTFCFIIFSIQRQNIFIEGGTMVLLNNGSSADLTIDSGETSDTGIVLTADVNAGNVRVLATSSNTGFPATLKYAVINWAA